MFGSISNLVYIYGAKVNVNKYLLHLSVFSSSLMMGAISYLVLYFTHNASHKASFCEMN